MTGSAAVSGACKSLQRGARLTDAAFGDDEVDDVAERRHRETAKLCFGIASAYAGGDGGVLHLAHARPVLDEGGALA